LTLFVALVLAVVVAANLSQAAEEGAVGESQIIARIAVPGRPFRVRTGYGSVWVLSRSRTSSSCSTAEPCTVSRIDPGSNRVIGKPIRLPSDGWNLAVGAKSVWVTQFAGNLIRIDARTGKISAKVSARPVYFGSAITFGGSFVWTGNDDERYKQGSTVSKLDPRTNRTNGKPLVLGSPQSLGFGNGALWVADHTGWLVKISPRRFKVIARTRLNFGPHGVVATGTAVYVADAHGARLLEADPKTAKIKRIGRLPVGVIDPVLGAGSIWSGSAAIWGGPPPVQDDRLLRVDPKTLSLVETLHLGGNVPGVAYGFGSVWAAVATGELVRIKPGA
jgi:DNA-binding beta-propeller fold protein YncE